MQNVGTGNKIYRAVETVKI